jgi:hypothetical protein
MFGHKKRRKQYFKASSGSRNAEKLGGVMAFLMKSHPFGLGKPTSSFEALFFSETLLKSPISSLAQRRKSEETCRGSGISEKDMVGCKSQF